MRPTQALVAAALAAALGSAAGDQAPDPSAVLGFYADLAHAKYADSFAAAQDLETAVATLIAAPTEANLAAARAAWKRARVPYQQSEAYRFGNPIVDAWEGKVNAWPLDEGLIDYLDAERAGGNPDENPLFAANVVATPKLTVAGQEIDATTVDKALIRSLHEADGIEANVTSGYHAIEFLLWGQDLNGTGPGAGKRPASDFDPANCTGGHCERRAAYLKAATELLLEDLAWMRDRWGKDGEARTAVAGDGSDPKRGLAAILTGLGSLSYGELAGERMKLGLLLHDPEEEHDCFSDNTAHSHFYNALGIANVYLGRYTRPDGSTLEGPSPSALVAAADPAADKAMRERLDATLARMQALVDASDAGTAYDQLIAAGNGSGNAMVQAAVDALVAQTRAIEGVIAALGLGNLTIEGSDSLDDPGAVGQ